MPYIGTSAFRLRSIELATMCQCHGSRFDISSGAVRNGPATEPLKRYEVRELEHNIQIRI